MRSESCVDQVQLRRLSCRHWSLPLLTAHGGTGPVAESPVHVPTYRSRRVRSGRVPAIGHAKAGTTELRTLAAYVEALGGRLEIIAEPQ